VITVVSELLVWAIRSFILVQPAANVEYFLSALSIGMSGAKTFPQVLFGVARLGAAIFYLPGDGMSTIYITSSDTAAWSFAIDNVLSRNLHLRREPASFLLMAVGLLLVPAIRRCRYFLGQLSNSWAEPL